MKQPHFHADTLDALSSPSYLARRLLTLLAEHYEVLFEDSRITFPQWTILMMLHSGLARSAADLARQMCHDAGAVTRLLDQLEGRGLVERVRDTNDRRIVNLVLTEGAQDLAQKLKPKVVKVLNAVLEDFSPDELATWVRLTTRMIAAMEDQPAGVLAPLAKEKAVR
jgi:DNA-binding MarR family transcriptional regulator